MSGKRWIILNPVCVYSISKSLKHSHVVWGESSLHHNTGFSLTRHPGVSIQETENQLVEKGADLAAGAG